jgi:hypothetical protein
MFSRITPSARTGLLAIAALITLAACGPSYAGYGVILWSSDEQKIATGSRVAVIAHSQLRKTVQVMAIDEGQKISGDPISVEQWRIREFPGFGEMREWADGSKEFLDQFVRSRKMALVVRSDPAIRDENIIYRLREQEDAKVLSRQEKETDAGGLKGYWYEILTQTGTRGWVFSVQVTPWRLGEKGTAATTSPDDAQLERLFAGNWRPEEFDLMIRTGEYDLGFFKPGTGLIVDKVKKTIHLATERDVMDFSYKSIERLGRSIWNLVGTSVQITFKDNSTIVVQYRVGNEVRTRIFIDLEQDIPGLYLAETQRRAAIVKRLAGSSGTVTSDNYGSIAIDASGNFTWDGADALKPRVIPGQAQANGSLSFDNYLAPELRGDYDGVASFNFGAGGTTVQVNFLYRWKPDGVQLEYLPNSLVKAREVKKSDSNPTVLFFGY